ncbi:MAG: PD40 domain-containing protein [Planctomycetaceae bacterium]|nr:PD40 domain-containing protein [Planctomycetaceae bacterium]
MTRWLASFVFAVAVVAASPARSDDDPLAAWRSGVRVRPVAPETEGHTIHSYFNTCPESPDGKWVLFFASSKADGQFGEVRIRNRLSGEEKVLAKDIAVEDAHRVACQQWASKGRRVVFHGERGGEWFVAAVDVESATERVLARGRLAGWGQPQADIVPLYGPHWNPGPHRDLELLNVETGEIRTAVTNDAVKTAYPEWLAKSYGDKPTSIFFPVLSPDSSRVFFKMAASSGGDARSTAASQRQGLVCYSLADQRFLFLRERWGHPAWHPDKKTIVEMAYTLIDSDTGKERRLPGLPVFRGDHPSASPDSKLIVTDTTMDKLGGEATEWGVIVANASGTDYVMLHHFDNSRGARSWRRSHPHPIFSPDGRRIYFNVSSGPWTQLFVAEAAEAR